MPPHDATRRHGPGDEEQPNDSAQAAGIAQEPEYGVEIEQPAALLASAGRHRFGGGLPQAWQGQAGQEEERPGTEMRGEE